eukprot:TRINITY_DN33449_c0_g1_i11.p1 TRINITY_DN33449_c0_g1~~TRINITY_DN33449_c0_g1_i11.p1  ORF type:complete len:366 (+),score=33.70 TRINITY_DN33449_c0_g1_i11:119-1216(+)
MFLAYASIRRMDSDIFDKGSKIISYFPLHEQLRVKHVATIYESWSTIGYINLTLTDKINEQIRVNSMLHQGWKPWSVSRTYRGLARLRFFDLAVFDFMSDKMANLLSSGGDFLQEDLQAIMQGVSYVQHKNPKLISKVKYQFEHELIVISKPYIIIDVMFGFQVTGFLPKDAFLVYVTRLCELDNQGIQVTDPTCIDKLASCFMIQGGYQLDGINSGMFDYLAQTFEKALELRKQSPLKVDEKQQQGIQNCLMELEIEFDTNVWLSDVGYFVGALIRKHNLVVEVESQELYTVRAPYRLLGQGIVRRMEMASSGYNMLVIPFHALSDISNAKLKKQIQKQLDQLGVEHKLSGKKGKKAKQMAISG